MPQPNPPAAPPTPARTPEPMNLSNVDDRTLDAALAMALGWAEVTDRTGVVLGFPPEEQPLDLDSERERVPRYASDPAAALAVVEAMGLLRPEAKPDDEWQPGGFWLHHEYSPPRPWQRGFAPAHLVWFRRSDLPLARFNEPTRSPDFARAIAEAAILALSAAALLPPAARALLAPADDA